MLTELVILTLPNLLAEGDLLSHVLPHEIVRVAGLPITNQMLMTLAAAILVLLMFGFASVRIRTGGQGIEAYNTHGRFPQLLEVICVYIRENVTRPNLGELTDKYIYYIWSVFFFILTINLLGMLPIGSVLGWGAEMLGVGKATSTMLSHVGGNANSNINITAAMATLSLIAIVAIGVKEQGTAYFKHFAPVPFKPWPMIPLAAFLVLLEIMGVVIKCVVLAMRLFGTMLAGHLVLAALIGLIFTFASVFVGIGVMVLAAAISLLELFIVFLQAFIFTFLTVLFIAAGAAHHGHEEHDEHDHEEHHPGLSPAAALTENA